MAKETKKTKKTAVKTVKKPVKKTAAKAVKTIKKAAVKTVKKPVVKTLKKAVVKEAGATKSTIIAAKSAEKNVKPAKKPRKQTPKDSGSIDFQIKNFTEKIQSLSSHLKVHQHDFDSRRGLLIMVGKRRRLLNYLRKAEPEKYAKVISDLKLKR